MELTLLIDKIKHGEKNYFLEVIEKMNPIIKKNARLLYKDEFEDIQSEFICALWEAVIRIEVYNNEGKCFNYLKNAIQNRFYELYRKSRKKFDNETYIPETSVIELGDIEKTYDNIIFTEDLLRLLYTKTSFSKQYVSFILINNLSDTEISDRMNVSRQYVNKLRRKIYKFIQNNYYT